MIRLYRMRAWLWSFVLGVPAVLGGCSGDDDSSLEDVCDIRESGCQRAIFEATANARGQSGARMPGVFSLSIQEFSALLDRGELSSRESDWDSLLPLVNLLPEGSSVVREISELRLSNVAAFYDPQTKRVAVIDRGEREDLAEQVFILAHEFAHALQDTHVDLVAFERAWITSLDSSVAIRALVEGEATVLGYAVLDRALTGSGRRIDWFRASEGLRASFFETLGETQTPLLAAEQLAPYAFGLEQLAPLWRGRGQAAVDALYGAPPLSLLDWLEDTEVTERSQIEGLDCLPTAGPPGFEGRDTDALGPLGVLAVLLYAGTPVESAWRIARGFRADRLVAFGETSTPDSRAIAWRIRFASEVLATTFVSRGSSALKPGTALESQDREVLYYGTTLPDRLSTWAERDHCGTAAELPNAPPEAPSNAARLRFEVARAARLARH